MVRPTTMRPRGGPVAREYIVALGWTPNTNHTGFYVAQAKGFYSEVGLVVKLKSPEEFEGSYSGELSAPDAAKDFPTPCGKVAAGVGDAQFAMNSPEGCVGWNSPAPRDAAVADVLAGGAG